VKKNGSLNEAINIAALERHYGRNSPMAKWNELH